MVSDYHPLLLFLLHLPVAITAAAYTNHHWSAGAVILSTGNARAGSVTANNVQGVYSAKQYGTNTTLQPAPSPDLQASSKASGYGSQSLFDQVTLQFDITPTNSGPVSFQYVFGSEEYPFFAPSASEFWF